MRPDVQHQQPLLRGLREEEMLRTILAQLEAMGHREGLGGVPGISGGLELMNAVQDAIVASITAEARRIFLNVWLAACFEAEMRRQ